MVTRRAFLQGSVAVSAGAAMLGAEPTLASWLQGGGRVVAVVDQRIGAGRQFSEALEAAGVPVQRDQHDPVRVLTRLSEELAPGGYTVIGLTQMATALVAERTGTDNGLRLAWRGEHRLLPDGQLQHAVRGSSLVASQSQLGLADDDWGYSLGRYLIGAPLGEMSSEQRFTAAVARPAQQAGYLVSWVLTPRV